MKKQNLLKKAKSAARLTVTLVLCLAVVLSIVPIGVSAASYQGYKWVRIHSREEFDAYCEGALTKSDGSISSGSEYETGHPASSDWFRIMMIYDGDNYFISGNNSCNDNLSFRGQRVLATYGIDTGKNEFKTVSGLNTPYIKYEGHDGDNNSNRYYVRFSDNDKLGSKYWTMYCKWYGIAHHAAARCDFNRPGRDVWDWKDDANWWSYQTFQWSGDKVRVFYNISGSPDRGWEIEGGGEIECTQAYDNSYFKVYMGVKCDIAVLTNDYTVNPGAPVNWNSVTVDSGVTVNVPSGATLVIDGVCYNNGTINVTGGKLIIRSVLDSSVGVTGSSGSITVNAGVLLVEDTGTLLTRNTDAAIKFENGSLVDVEGIAVIASPFKCSSSAVRVGFGAAFLLGVTPYTTTSQSAYNKAWIAGHQSSCLDSLCEEPAKSAVSRVLGNSSVVSNGIFYMSPWMSITTSEDESSVYSFWNTLPYISVYKSSNVHASLQSMMRKW